MPGRPEIQGEKGGTGAWFPRDQTHLNPCYPARLFAPLPPGGSRPDCARLRPWPLTAAVVRIGTYFFSRYLLKSSFLHAVVEYIHTTANNPHSLLLGTTVVFVWRTDTTRTRRSTAEGREHFAGLLPKAGYYRRLRPTYRCTKCTPPPSDPFLFSERCYDRDCTFLAKIFMADEGGLF